MKVLGVWLSIASVSFVSSLAATAEAGNCLKPTPVAFHRGTSSTIVAGGVIRAESVCYVVSAKAGQALHLVVRSPDQNVVVTAYEPGYIMVPRSGDDPDFKGSTLPGASDRDEATRLNARLPATGKYLLVLGTTRGAGGEFNMKIGVR